MLISFFSFLSPEAAQRKRDKAAASSAPPSGRSTPVNSPVKKKVKGPPPPLGQKPQPAAVSQLQMDVEAFGLSNAGSSSGQRTRESSVELPESPMPSTSALPVEEIIAEVERRSREEKPTLSLVVVGAHSPHSIKCRCKCGTGHVDAGKSTLMGRLLHDIGETSDRTLQQNQRQSQKLGKASFAYAWTFDALPEERERCVCGSFVKQD
jgi:elongation factor 1 alpha-like protein